MIPITTPRPREEIKADAKALLKACAKAKTCNIKDKDGRIWRFGTWYGDTPHFRTGFGHWSEMVLDVSNFDQFAPYTPATEQDLGDWEQFYKESPSSEDSSSSSKNPSSR
jgi:hypothetical protein